MKHTVKNLSIVAYFIISLVSIILLLVSVDNPADASVLARSPTQVILVVADGKDAQILQNCLNEGFRVSQMALVPGVFTFVLEKQ